MVKRKLSPSLSPDIIRIAGLGCIFLLGVALVIMGVTAFLRSTPFFVVRDIVLADGLQSLDIPELLKLKGQNIFDADLTKIEAKIRLKYPQLSSLRVMRRLPDQIFVMALRRDPFAQVVFDNRACVIDRNAFMIGAPVKDQAPLVPIKGLKGQRVSPGDVVSDEKVQIALEIIALFHQDGRLQGLELVAVHVGDPTRIICDIKKDDVGFQVIVDKEHIAQRLRILLDVLARGGLDLQQVKYMDLRFGEPVIGQKKVKK